MPHTKSAAKRLRQNLKRNRYNRKVKKQIKLQIRAFLEVLKNGTIEQAQEQYNLTAKRLDKAAARNVIHRNRAARKKSQFSKMLHRKRTGNAPAAKPQ
jgi:small subunit ribosomal protein S20